MREPRTPFALILWENVAYLVDDAVRGRAFDGLKREVGIAPIALLAAPLDFIARVICEGGMNPAHRAGKLVRCAEIAVDYANGDLDATLGSMPVPKGRRLVKRFPGIGDPGADKVLLLCGLGAVPALDSNGLRVLVRLGFARDDVSYARSYKSGVAAFAKSGFSAGALVEAFALLRAHGRELCKRNGPACPVCALRTTCNYAR